MRFTTPLLAAGLALAVATQAFAQGAGSPTSPGAGASSEPSTSQPPNTGSSTSTSKSAQPDQGSAPSANGSGAPASANAPGGAQASAAPSFSVGESVKDNTGAEVGTISGLSGSGANQMAVIKMGDQSFQVQANRLGSTNGAAEINMTKAQITAMLHSSAK